MGAAYGTAKSGVGVASMGVMRPELVMKSIVPVVMAGVLGIYGLIIAVIISTGINPKSKPYYVFDGYAHLSSGLSCGLAGLSAGMAIGIVGDAGVRYSFRKPFSVMAFFNCILEVKSQSRVISEVYIRKGTATEILRCRVGLVFCERLLTWRLV